MQSTEPTICTIDGCEKPVKRKALCYGHYMKQWRYGDPLHVPFKPKHDLLGERFGALVVAEYIPAKRSEGGSLWLCRCDCGRVTRVRTGDLRRGSAQSCGGAHHRYQDVIGIGGAHDRVKRMHGSASQHRCVDCGGLAAHWSYDHRDENERIDDKRGPYSLDPAHYEARCVPCHKRFDLDYLARIA
ncbi:hypothetical protein [Microbacterium soli]|uniref:HNH endonuclease n=1 Tax=Microbacterium soli TaxID=446075 RepID=A0ABP7NKQ1_9MICO